MAWLLRMPEVAANTVEAVLSEWSVGENTPFTANFAIATIETDKAVVDVPADADGVILKTLVAAGTTVRVGDPIALLGEAGETVSDLDALLVEFGVSGSPAPDRPAGAAGAGAGMGAGIESMATSAVVADRAQPELGAPGQVVAVGARSEAAASGAVLSNAVVTDPVATVRSPANGQGGRVFSSPLARKLAREAGLPFADLVGTGPGGRIVRRDVQKAQAGQGTGTVSLTDIPAVSTAQAGSTAAEEETTAERAAAQAGSTASAGSSASSGEWGVPREPSLATGSQAVPDVSELGYIDVPHSRMRRTIANRLTQSSQDAPHFTIHGSVRMDKLLRLRAKLNAAGSVKISINDLLVMAAARAHVMVPAMNVIWRPDAVRRFASIDVAVAVATERGLVTPVIRGIDRMTVSAVARATSDLAARARSGRLRQEELEGGTLTVTNLGVYGTEDFSAIINSPQAAILAVGAARPEPLVRRGKLTVGTVLKVTLSVDHRPVDGAVAAQWMAAFVALVEKPLQILV